ncbi:hypothetical protein QTN25_008053 [Entamoeba marina]
MMKKSSDPRPSVKTFENTSANLYPNVTNFKKDVENTKNNLENKLNDFLQKLKDINPNQNDRDGKSFDSRFGAEKFESTFFNLYKNITNFITDVEDIKKLFERKESNDSDEEIEIKNEIDKLMNDFLKKLRKWKNQAMGEKTGFDGKINENNQSGDSEKSDRNKNFPLENPLEKKSNDESKDFSEHKKTFGFINSNNFNLPSFNENDTKSHENVEEYKPVTFTRDLFNDIIRDGNMIYDSKVHQKDANTFFTSVIGKQQLLFVIENQNITFGFYLESKIIGTTKKDDNYAFVLRDHDKDIDPEFLCEYYGDVSLLTNGTTISCTIEKVFINIKDDEQFIVNNTTRFDVTSLKVIQFKENSRKKIIGANSQLNGCFC